MTTIDDLIDALTSLDDRTHEQDFNKLAELIVIGFLGMMTAFNGAVYALDLPDTTMLEIVVFSMLLALIGIAGFAIPALVYFYHRSEVTR